MIWCKMHESWYTDICHSPMGKCLNIFRVSCKYRFGTFQSEVLGLKVVVIALLQIIIGLGFNIVVVTMWVVHMPGSVSNSDKNFICDDIPSLFV